MEQKIIEKPALKEDILAQLIEVFEKILPNRENNQREKGYYHHWTMDERAFLIGMVLEDSHNRNSHNRKRVSWKKIAVKLNNGCSADACKAYYYRILREPLIQIYREYKSSLRPNDIIGDMNKQINYLTNAYIFFETNKTSGGDVQKNK